MGGGEAPAPPRTDAREAGLDSKRADDTVSETVHTTNRVDMVHGQSVVRGIKGGGIWTEEFRRYDNYEKTKLAISRLVREHHQPRVEDDREENMATNYDT